MWNRKKPFAVLPRHQQAELIALICKLIETSAVSLSLKEFAITAGFSQYHFQRLFKEVVGMTPKQYAIAQRAKWLRNELNQETSITQVIIELSDVLIWN